MASSLLDRAIKEHKIPAWPYQAAFDRVVVFSVPEDKASRETYAKGGAIIKPVEAHDNDMNQTPRGIICAAGLSAMDYLYSHGMGVGEMAWVARLSPWRHEVERTEKDGVIEFLFLRAGDLVGSEDLLASMRAGRVTIERGEDGRHYYKYAKGVPRPRFDPPSYVG